MENKAKNLYVDCTTKFTTYSIKHSCIMQLSPSKED
jgi:hypothetical protein